MESDKNYWKGKYIIGKMFYVNNRHKTLFGWIYQC